MSAAQPNETEEIPEGEEKRWRFRSTLRCYQHPSHLIVDARNSDNKLTRKSADSHSYLSSPPYVFYFLPGTEETPLPEGIKPSYWNDLDLLEDLWKVGLGRLFDQGDIYVDRNGKTVCTGKDIMWESREHTTLKNSVARSFNQWARNTDKEKNLYCTTEAPVDVTNTYRGGHLVEEMDDLTKLSHRSVDVAVYSGERHMRGRCTKILTILETYVEPVETAETEGRKRQKVTKERICTIFSYRSV